MNVHDRGVGGPGGPGFIEQVKGLAEKGLSTIKGAFSDIKLPDTAKVKQEMENVQTISKQIGNKMTLKMLGTLCLPGSREKIYSRLEKMDDRKELTPDQALKGMRKAEETEIKARGLEFKFGMALVSLGKHLGSEKIRDEGMDLAREGLKKGPAKQRRDAIDAEIKKKIEE